jgi:taurine dioxygenase
MTLELRPLHREFGAEIIGVDLTQELAPSLFDEIEAAYYEYGLLLFAGQHLGPASQAALTRRFGAPKIAARKEFNDDAHPEVARIGNIRANGKPVAFFNRQGVEWHSDSAGRNELDVVTLLYAVEVPRIGGDTMFCSMPVAWETLPTELRQRIDGRHVLHSWNWHNDKVLRLSPGAARPLGPAERAQHPDVRNELVQRHPVTGRALYFVSHNLARTIDGMDEAKTETLVMTLVAHATQKERIYRHRWRAGDLMIWDNRAMMHSATEVGSYEADRRLMHRSSALARPPGEAARRVGRIAA